MKVYLLLLAFLLATAVKAESPSQDEAEGNDEVAEFDSDLNEMPSDDDNDQESAEVDAVTDDPDEVEALEEDFSLKDPLKARSYYCGLCNVCRYCKRSRRCSSSRLSSVCGGCKYCSLSYYRRLIRRIRIPRVRIPRVRWGRRRRRWGGRRRRRWG